MHRPFAIAALILALACSPQALAQTLPDPLAGTVTLDVSAGPVTFPGNSTIDPGGATIQFIFGGADTDFIITGGPLDLDYLVVGGGGGGGTSTTFGTAGSGGGGAGGVVAGTLLGATGTLEVAVGVGGAPGGAGNNMGFNGEDSSLGTIVALGGGGGAGGNNSGLDGGSGGGGRGGGTSGGAGLQPGSASGGFGTGGGTGGGAEGAGGGGGAGGAGANAVGDDGGAGGAAFESSISGAPQFYGGGGGGGGRTLGTPGSGGSGVGGSGANNNIDATPGLPATGGGGGGGNNDRLGAPGGSGIVIISYAGAQAATGGTITSSGGNTIHTFDLPTGGERTGILPGVISGSGSLTFDDPGTLVLNGNNTYTGGTVIDQGTIRLGNGNALGAGGSSVLINPGGTLDINGVNTNASGLYDVTVAGGTITSTTGNQMNALRFVTLTADSTFTGSNRWDIRGSGAGQFNAQLDLGGHTLTKTGSDMVAIVDATISAGTINVESGEFGLTRSNWSGGTVNVNGGTLWFENNSTGSYNIDVNLNGATLRSSGPAPTLSGPLTLTGTAAQNTIQVDNNTFTLAGTISGSGGFTKTGGGNLTLNGDNTYSGGTTISGGIVTPGQNTSLGTGPVTINSGGTLNINNRNLQALPITLNGGSLINNTGWPQNAVLNVSLTADSSFGGSSRFDMRGGGTLDLAGHTLTKTDGNKVSIVDSTITAGTINVDSGIFGLTRSSWTSGTANVAGGTLEFENNAGANHSYGMAINLDGGTLHSRGGGITTASGPISLTGANTLFIENNTFTSTGTISGAGSLEKTGGGTLNINGNNTYTGGTTISGGTVIPGQNTSLGTGPVTINSDGTLDINARNLQALPITLNGGTITNTGSGQQNALRTVTLTADSTFTGSGRWDIRGSGAGQFNAQLDLGGHTLTKTGGNKIAIVDATITAGTINVESGEFGLTRSNWSGGTVNVNGGSLWFENNSVGSYDIDVNLNGATLRSNGNPTTLSGPLTLTGTQAQNTIQVDNSTFTLAGGIAGSGGFTKQGGGVLVLPTANTHSGTNNLVGGAVEIGHDQAFGTGLLDLRGSAIRSTSAADRTINNAISLSSNTTFGSAGTGNLTFTGNMNKGGLPKTINIQNEVTTFTGTITGGGTGEMVKTGPGRAVFDGNVTYPGATNVVEGTLEINGTVTNSPVTVLSDGRLSGSGSINTSLTVDGGTLAPGSADLFGLGTLTVNGPIDFASTWEVSFLGTDASLLDHSGSFNSSLNDITLAAGDTFSPLTFVPYQIYQGDSQDPLQGLFQGFSLGGFGSLDDATGTGEINGTLFAAYINSTLDGQGNLVSGNGIVLFAIPEPGRAMLAVIGLFAMLLRRRR